MSTNHCLLHDIKVSTLPLRAWHVFQGTETITGSQYCPMLLACCAISSDSSQISHYKNPILLCIIELMHNLHVCHCLQTQSTACCGGMVCVGEKLTGIQKKGHIVYQIIEKLLCSRHSARIFPWEYLHTLPIHKGSFTYPSFRPSYSSSLIFSSHPISHCTQLSVSCTLSPSVCLDNKISFPFSGGRFFFTIAFQCHP